LIRNDDHWACDLSWSRTQTQRVRILVIALAGIGDCLIATPLIRELRLQYPEAALEALVFWPGSRDLLEGNPHLNVVHQKNLVKEGYFRSMLYLLELRRRRFDLSINAHPQGPIHYRFAAGIINAPLRLSHRYEGHGWLDHWLVNRTVAQDYTIHSIENNRRLIELLNLHPRLARPEMEIYLAPEDETWAVEFIQRQGLRERRCLGVHVGSGGTKNLKLKRWPLGHYMKLLAEFMRRHPDVAVLLFGGPEEEAAHREILTQPATSGAITVSSRSLKQAAALMKHCRAFLSVDTALMHLAAAMKVPRQVVIEAPTLNPTNWPWNNGCRVVCNPTVNGRNLEYYRYDGGPIRGTPEQLQACMASVKVEDVLAAVEEAIA
jgi:ADP-heptose:LPS heptosyltransferase